MFRNLFNQNNIPKINCLIGLTTLSFQLLILNPWHSHISEQISSIKDEINRTNIKNIDK
jgi:hypothetical protein